jgi:VanZ family protein
MTIRSHWILKSLFAVALLIITWASLRPKAVVETALHEEQSQLLHDVMDVIEYGPHFAAYALLLIFGALIFRQRRILLILSVALISISFVFEGLQVWVPGRDPSVPDMIANVLGILSGVAFSIFVLPKLAKRFRKPA